MGTNIVFPSTFRPDDLSGEGQPARRAIFLAKYADVLRNAPVISSASFDWNGLLVEQFHNPAGYFDIPASTSHCLTIHLQQNILLKREIAKRFQRAQMCPGAITFTPAFFRSQWEAEGEADVLYIHLEPHLLSTLMGKECSEQKQAWATDALAIDDSQIRYLGLALKAEIEAGSPSGKLYYDSVITAIAARLQRRFCLTSPDDRIVSLNRMAVPMTRVAEYVQEHLDTDLSLTELAQVVTMSIPHFRAHFKRAFGIAPYQYVTQCRVERAKQLLLAGKPIGEVAQRVGFADQSHLTRHMRRLLGVTPGAFKPS